MRFAMLNGFGHRTSIVYVDLLSYAAEFLDGHDMTRFRRRLSRNLVALAAHYDPTASLQRLGVHSRSLGAHSRSLVEDPALVNARRLPRKYSGPGMSTPRGAFT